MALPTQECRVSISRGRRFVNLGSMQRPRAWECWLSLGCENLLTDIFNERNTKYCRSTVVQFHDFDETGLPSTLSWSNWQSFAASAGEVQQSKKLIIGAILVLAASQWILSSVGPVTDSCCNQASNWHQSRGCVSKTSGLARGVMLFHVLFQALMELKSVHGNSTVLGLQPKWYSC